MRKAIKKHGSDIKAYQLGTSSSILDELIAEGKIKKLNDETYEIFSQEAQGGKGEIAHKGDYIKIDSQGSPYPNDKDFFENNHKHIRDDVYEQIPKEIEIWESTDPMCPEIEFLINKKGLKIRQDNYERYFGAELWGTWLTAAKDAVIIFYEINRDENGKIIDLDFNFVSRSEFNKNYMYI